MNSNPFVLDKSEYKRNLDIFGTYIADSTTYLQKMTGKSAEECRAFVINSVKPGGQFAFKDPKVLYLNRKDNGDRERVEGTLSKYLGEAIKGNELIAPTLTTYLPPTHTKSLLVDFIDDNVKARGVAKKAMFAAKVAGNKVLQTVKNMEQTNKKLANNSISGAHVSASNPLYNKTGHSTLTSNCRSTSGYGNANNEKFLCGNRHYWSPDIVRNNIISIINHSNYDLIQSAMIQFGLRHPTEEETVECILYSTRLYWSSKIEVKRIKLLVSKLSDIERSAFVYTGDLYHLMKCNDSVVRTFITRLSSKIEVVHSDPDSVLNSAPGDNVILASQICSKETKGTTVKATAGTPAYGIIASTVENIGKVIDDYSLLIKAFWVTENLPASMAVFPESIRRSAITSDTDSTIFTVQDWVQWYQGNMSFNDNAISVAASMVFLASQTITHVLARMSANFGIEEKRIHQVAMKNEFFFPVFVPTQVAKHYYALISCQEGNVFSEYDREIKGVHLKSSNAPKSIMAEAKKMMDYIMLSTVENKKISINHIFKWIADIERDVIKSIKEGSSLYFRKAQIKTSDSYIKDAENSPFATYGLWNEVFGPKYGIVPPPPYMCIKVSTNLDSPAKTKEWMNRFEDRELADRLTTWMENCGRKHLGTTFMVPEQCISGKGIPPEILDAVGVRKMVLDCCNVFYIILESLNIFMLNKNITRLISDTH